MVDRQPKHTLNSAHHTLGEEEETTPRHHLLLGADFGTQRLSEERECHAYTRTANCGWLTENEKRINIAN